MSREDEIIRKLADMLAKRFVDEGLLVEAGWQAYRSFMNPDAPEIQFEECRTAFFAGAQHLFGSLISMLDPGNENTAKDIERMTQINAELAAFAVTFAAKHGISL